MDPITYKVEVDSDGSKEWYLNDKLHREDGPAVEYFDGSKEWYLKGIRHREDGPAVEDADGCKEWWLNGKLHREDGPALNHLYGSKEWYLDGFRYTEKEFNKKMSAAVEMTWSEIEALVGKKIKVVK